jgi:nitrite reductase/ring-hydroxylating ferredoxin subunit
MLRCLRWCNAPGVVNGLRLAEVNVQDYWRLRPGAPPIGTLIASLSEVPEAHAREFRFGQGLSAFRMIVARSEGTVQGYLNLCPHLSLPLNEATDDTIFIRGSLLVCVRHFAQFQVCTGICVAGPCLGSRLDRVPIHLDRHDNIRVGEANALTQTS